MHRDTCDLYALLESKKERRNWLHVCVCMEFGLTRRNEWTEDEDEGFGSPHKAVCLRCYCRQSSFHLFLFELHVLIGLLFGLYLVCGLLGIFPRSIGLELGFVGWDLSWAYTGIMSLVTIFFSSQKSRIFFQGVLLSFEIISNLFELGRLKKGEKIEPYLITKKFIF